MEKFKLLLVFVSLFLGNSIFSQESTTIQLLSNDGNTVKMSTTTANVVPISDTATNTAGEDMVTVDTTVNVPIPDITVSEATVTATAGTEITEITIDSSAGGTVTSVKLSII